MRYRHFLSIVVALLYIVCACATFYAAVRLYPPYAFFGYIIPSQKLAIARALVLPCVILGVSMLLLFYLSPTLAKLESCRDDRKVFVISLPTVMAILLSTFMPLLCYLPFFFGLSPAFASLHFLLPIEASVLLSLGLLGRDFAAYCRSIPNPGRSQRAQIVLAACSTVLAALLLPAYLLPSALISVGVFYLAPISLLFMVLGSLHAVTEKMQAVSLFFSFLTVILPQPLPYLDLPILSYLSLSLSPLYAIALWVMMAMQKKKTQSMNVMETSHDI